MKKRLLSLFLSLALLCTLGLTALATAEEEVPTATKLTIQVVDTCFTATLEENDTTRALVERLPMTLPMEELNGNEKYYYLPDPLSTDVERPGTLCPGDLMLYGDDCLVLFYEGFSSPYRYTRLGRMDNPSGLAAALGCGGVDVTFRMEE